MNLSILLKTALASALLSTVACKNDLNPVEGRKDIPVIFGAISITDTATYIRVEKAFADPTKSALDIAQIPDSLYYDDATVTLVKIKSNERFILKKVDGNTEGYPREKGVFASAPNFIYKIKNNQLNLAADQTWRVEVQRKTDVKPLAESKAVSIVGVNAIAAPLNNVVLNFGLTNNTSIRVETGENSARLYDANVIFNFTEAPLANPSQTTVKKVVWRYANGSARAFFNNAPDITTTFRQPAGAFYDFLQSSLIADPSIVRKAINVDIEVNAGGQEFSDYINSASANTGITGSQSITSFTNIDRGLGLFVSRSNVKVTDFKLSQEMLENLKSSTQTKNLNFR